MITLAIGFFTFELESGLTLPSNLTTVTVAAVMAALALVTLTSSLFADSVLKTCSMGASLRNLMIAGSMFDYSAGRKKMKIYIFLQ